MIILKWSKFRRIFALFCSSQYFQEEFDIFDSSPVKEDNSAVEQNFMESFTMDQQPMNDFGDMFDIQVCAHTLFFYL